MTGLAGRLDLWDERRPLGIFDKLDWICHGAYYTKNLVLERFGKCSFAHSVVEFVQNMEPKERAWLLFCASLAVGEGLAALAPAGANAWPFPLVAAVPVALLGYGFSCRGWRHVVVFLLGLAAFWFASVESERNFRMSPWMRGVRRRERTVCESSALRRDLSRRVGIGLAHDPETVALNRAMLLGERSAMPRSAKRIFVESGAIHVFAISGLHVMVIARVFVFLFAVLCVPHRLRGVVAMPAVWGYVVVSGASPSAVRAALMATFYSAAHLFWRRPNGLTSWAMAFAAIHLVNPLQIVDIGSQLSFSVMLAIALAVRVARNLRGEWRKWLCVSHAAWAAGVPIAGHVFGRITPGGLVANLVLIAAAGYSVAAGVVGIIASYVSETLAAHLNNLAALTTDFMVLVATLVAKLPFANFEMEKWGVLECAEWYVALALSFVLVGAISIR